MKVEQIYQIVNQMQSEILGQTDLTVAEDLSNIVEVGVAIFDSISVDNYVRKLLDHIGKVVFVNRPYSGRAPSVRMDGWEYGAVLQKVDMGIPKAEENPTWQLKNGETYNQDKFTVATDIGIKFFSKRTTFEVAFSFAEEQVKSAFSNVEQLNGFFSMIYTQIDTSMTIALDGLIMGTINNFTANVYLAGGAQAVNLLSEYKKIRPNSTVTAATAMYDLDFIKFAAYQLKMYSRRLGNASTVFNMGKRVRHTPRDRQKIIMLDAFSDAADVYLQSDTFHEEFTKMPVADVVSYWQGSGETYSFSDVSQVHIIPATADGAGTETTIDGLLCVMFDREALGVNNYNRRVTNHYNGHGEFINNWFKMDAQYFNDFNENFIMFYIKDVENDGGDDDET